MHQRIRNVWPRLWRAAAAILSGFLMWSAFPPLESSEAAWVALVPLLFVARFSPPLGAFGWGWAGGLCGWLPTLGWLLQLGRTGAPWGLAVLGWAALAAYCALYTGAFTLLASALFRLVPVGECVPRDAAPQPFERRLIARARSVGAVFLLPLLWVGLEYVRSTLATGFPWNQLGVSQYRNLAVIQLAEWGGVYLVSAVVVVLNAGLFIMGLRLGNVYLRRSRGTFQLELSAAFLVCLVVWVSGVRLVRSQSAVERFDPAVRIAVIQPNVAQRKKWQEGFEREIFRRLEETTDLVLPFREAIDLVVWPETAVPGPLNRDGQTRAFVEGLARGAIPLLVGSMEVLPGDPAAAAAVDREPIYYNSSFLVDTNGMVQTVYRKQHLVPFGEYLPFDRVVPLIRRLAPLGFSCTPGEESTLFHLEVPARGTREAASAGSGAAWRLPFGVLICFEDTMPYLARRAVRGGARLLVVQTNDAWFDPSAGSLQHLSHCVFRCVENRVPAVRAANTGVSACIDRTGAIDDVELLSRENWGREITAYRVGSLAVPLESYRPTFYTRWGDWPFAIPCAVLSVGLFVLVMVVEKRKNTCPKNVQEVPDHG